VSFPMADAIPGRRHPMTATSIPRAKVAQMDPDSSSKPPHTGTKIEAQIPNFPLVGNRWWRRRSFTAMEGSMSENPSLAKARAVIFDLDGTLLDTLDDLADSANAVLAAHGHDKIPAGEYKQLIGDGMAKLVERSMNGSRSKPSEAATEAQLAEALGEFQNEYSKRWNHKTRVYPGIAELLDELTERGIAIGVLSNKRHEFTVKCVDEFLAEWSWGAVFGQRDGVERKPDPAGAFDAARALGIDPGHCLYVGDSGVDMHTAVRAGMVAVGVLWGFRDAAELRGMGADHLIEVPQDLLVLL